MKRQIVLWLLVLTACFVIACQTDHTYTPTATSYEEVDNFIYALYDDCLENMGCWLSRPIIEENKVSYTIEWDYRNNMENISLQIHLADNNADEISRLIFTSSIPDDSDYAALGQTIMPYVIQAYDPTLDVSDALSLLEQARLMPSSDGLVRGNTVYMVSGQTLHIRQFSEGEDFKRRNPDFPYHKKKSIPREKRVQ